MASVAFKNALKNLRETKTVDTLLTGGANKWLGDGTHDVVVQGVDTKDIDQDKVNITYADADGKTYTDRMYTMNKDKNGFSASFRRMVAGIFGKQSTIAALDTFVDTLMDDPATAFEMLAGMKLRISLAPGRGYTVKATSDGQYAAYDVESGNCVGPTLATIEDVRQTAETQGLRRAYTEIKKTEATHAEANATSLNFAVEARKKVGKSGSTVQFQSSI